MLNPFTGQAQAPAQIFPSFAHFREVVDACPFVTIVLNHQRQIVFFNRALAALSGPTEQSALLGRKLGEALRCDHAIEGEGCGMSETCQTCGAFLAVGEGLKGVESVKEARLIRKVGDAMEVLDVQVSVSPIVAGGERFVACFVRDISHEKRKDALDRIFFHDILNSATGVELLAGALHSLAEGDASAFAGQIRACATQMVEEIHSQQQLLSAEKDELAVSVVSMSSAEAIRDAVAAVRGSALMDGRALVVAADSHDVTFETDPSILRRVLRNMILNALEASQPAETIAVGCVDHGDHLEFRVHNPGVVPPPVRPRIFQKSFSTKGAGRGMGTYCIKLLSERYLKGAVRFRSTKSEGTSFYARYPKRQTHRQAAQSPLT